jgi:hypothetical protein
MMIRGNKLNCSGYSAINGDNLKEKNEFTTNRTRTS